MELLPLGPDTIIDTAGHDDEGTLGKLRIDKTMQVLGKTDIALIVVDATVGLTNFEHDIIKLIKEKHLPYIIVYNKADLLVDSATPKTADNIIYVSAKTKQGIYELKEKIGTLGKNTSEKFILKDIVNSGDTAVLVIPIDKAAPKGRLILPQQQVIRELLDIGATAVMTQDDNLAHTLSNLKTKPALVITDSQAFAKVNKIVPPDIKLTSFSILFARYKGNLQRQLNAVKTLDTIKSGDKILIAEGCTHHRQCDDIGTVKMPRWIRNYTKSEPTFVFTSGTEFPQDLSPYKFIIHCGGCMLNEREMKSRLQRAAKQHIPMSNYGMIIAYVNGILKRTLQVFPEL